MFKIFFFLFWFIFISSCTSGQNINSHKRIKHQDDIAMVVSVSSDGNYAVSSHLNGELVLWNIRNKTHRIITDNANIYSAYFIKNSDKFMWQDDDTNQVYVEDAKGNIAFSFNPGFPTYGQIMTSDLKRYIASDINWSIFAGPIKNLKMIKNGYGNKMFIGGEKLLNLTLSNDGRLLLTSGAMFNDNYDKLPLSKGIDAHRAGIIQSELGNFSLIDGNTIWSIKTGKPLYKLSGNGAKTIATLSPDGKYVVGGDEGEQSYIWNTQTGQRYLKVSPTLYNMPKDFINYQLPYSPDERMDTVAAIFALKFITDQDYLRITTSVNYAILYNVNNPRPLRYLRFTPTPLALNGNWQHDNDLMHALKLPSNNDDYSRDETFDTSPKAHILVTGQGTEDGINVYKYDPQAQTLTEIWSPSMHDNESKPQKRLTYQAFPKKPLAIENILQIFRNLSRFFYLKLK